MAQTVTEAVTGMDQGMETVAGIGLMRRSARA